MEEVKETLRRGFAKMRGSAGAFLPMEEPLLRKSYALSPPAPAKGQSGRISGRISGRKSKRKSGGEAELVSGPFPVRGGSFKI